MSANDPSDDRERVEAALKPWGWTCGPEFWDRYHQDAWVFNLTNALTRVTAELERLQSEGKVLAEGTVTKPPHPDQAFVPTVIISLDEHAGLITGQQVKLVAGSTDPS